MERRALAQDRRTQNLRAVIYGSVYGRRRSNRRPVDDQRFLVDVFDPGLVMVSLAIIGMSCVDAFFTLNLLAMGAHEANYFMRVLLEADTRLFLTIKLVATGCGVVFLTAMARYRLCGRLQVRRVMEVVCAVYACVIIWELYLLAAIAAVQAI